MTRPPVRERRVGEHAHQPHVRAAVDELDPALGELVAEVGRRGAVGGVAPRARAGETQTRFTRTAQGS